MITLKNWIVVAPFAVFNVVFLTRECRAFTSSSPSLLGDQNIVCCRHPVRCYSSIEKLQNTAGVDFDQLSELDNCKSGTEARNLLDSLYRSDEVSGSPLYGSVRIVPDASAKGLSDADLAIQTKVRNRRYTIMELIELNGDKDADRASLGLLALMVASVSSALVANQNLPGPEILRFVVVWFFSFAPLAFVGAGIAKPEKLQTLLVSIQRNVFPSYRKRTIQHEAGHFLIGHLLGLPIKGYSANSIKNAVEFHPLNDPNAGRDRASKLGFDSGTKQDFQIDESISLGGDAPYFSKEGRGAEVMEKQSVFRKKKDYANNPFLKLPSLNEPTKAWPYRGFDHMTIDKLTAISVAGVCAEILAFGNAEGGFADFSQLRMLFNSAEPELDEKDAENRIRYFLGFVMSQLRLHLGALDELAEAMERGASVAECVHVIENCSNIRGGDGIMGDYDRLRREKFKAEGIGLAEKLLLGGKNEDVEEDRVTTGIGGGDRKQSFAITGDDPLYAALAVAFVFLTWASNGGLTLH